MHVLVPNKIFFTKGKGVHREKLAAFEWALRAAGLAPYNLVSVSSIYPPRVVCKRIPREEGLKLIKPGCIVHSVLARQETNEPSRLICASIGVAVPKDRKMYGYLSEHHPFGETARHAGEYAEDLAAQMLATTLGVDFNPDTAWNEKEEVFRMSGQIVNTFNVTQSAKGNKNGLWTAVISAAVLVIDR